jgi:hypothetical protein
MSNLDNLLSRLDKVKRTGKGNYQSCCPAHNDRGPSLSIRETDDGRILVRCFAGCDVHEVVGAVGLDISALFPEREIQNGKPERRPFPAMDALRGIAFEALVVVAAGTAMLAGESFQPDDRERLILAIERIQSALSAVMPQMRGARHG